MTAPTDRDYAKATEYCREFSNVRSPDCVRLAGMFAAAREEGRREPREECARLVDIYREAHLASAQQSRSCLDRAGHLRSAATLETMAERIRALLPEPPQAEGEQ